MSYTEKTRRGELNLFYEAAEVTLASASIFAISDLRKVARKKQLPSADAQDILQLPISGTKLRELREKHKDMWDNIMDSDVMALVDSWNKKFDMKPSLIIHEIGDENSDSECVHYIARDDTRRVILCVFRGSVTLTDWIQDTKLMIDRVPSPVRDVEGQSEMIGIHLGFRNYILGQKNDPMSTVSKAIKAVENAVLSSATSRSTRGDKSQEGKGGEYINGIKRPKIEVILEQLRAMKEKYPTYPIYVAGHSLGGALALIATLWIASDPALAQMPSETPQHQAPVTCITVGNPKPGDGDFCRSIEYLERTQKLRCCVIHNSMDVVPMLGTNATRSDGGFWHPGWRLVLHRHHFEWGRARKATADLTTKQEVVDKVGCCGKCWRGRGDSTGEKNESFWNIPSGIDPVQYAKDLSQQRINRHNHREYLERILRQEDHLKEICLSNEKLWEEDACKKSSK